MSSAPAIIRPVQNKKDKKAFVDLAWEVYKNDPAWVPPLKDEVHGLIESWTTQRTKWTVMETFGANGVPCSAVYDTGDLLTHRHMRERGMVQRVEHPAGTYDVVLGDCIWPAEFGSKGIVVDLSSKVKELPASQIFPGAIQMANYQGKYFQFDEAHIEDSVCITALHGGFGTKLAWLAAPDREIVFVGRDDNDAHMAAGLAAAVGVRTVRGYLAGGMTSWRLDGRPVQRVERIGVERLHELRAADAGLQVLDVREVAEWRDGHIPGALHMPYHDLDELPPGLDPGLPVAVICASGQRSAVAAGLVQRLGAPVVLHVAGGGVPSWGRAGHPIEAASS